MMRIATRQSPMAIVQTQKVMAKLQTLYPGLAIELVPLSTKGDQILDRSLAELGGKGLFIKTLEEALLKNEADIAVHSLKDMPPVLAPSFLITAVLPRLSPYDVLVSKQAKLTDLPKGAMIGTSSVRRQAELLAIRPDLTPKMIRGNVNTRLAKLDAGEYDALILGEAGLMHLDFTNRITEVLSPDVFLPSVGQGVIAIEILKQRQDLIEMLAPLNDLTTFACISAERAMNTALGASCTSPVGSFAAIKGDLLTLRGAVFSADGQTKIETYQSSTLDQALAIGEAAAKDLILKGAKKLL